MRAASSIRTSWSCVEWRRRGVAPHAASAALRTTRGPERPASSRAAEAEAAAAQRRAARTTQAEGRAVRASGRSRRVHARLCAEQRARTMSGAAPRASLSRAGETAATGQTGPNRRPSVGVRVLSRDIPRAAPAPARARRMPSDGFCSHGARSERAAGVASVGRAGGGDRPRRVETVMLGLHDGYPPRLARRGTCVGRDGSSARPLIRRSHAAEGRGSARAGVPLTALCGGGRAISRA